MLITQIKEITHTSLITKSNRNVNNYLPIYVNVSFEIQIYLKQQVEHILIYLSSLYQRSES